MGKVQSLHWRLSENWSDCYDDSQWELVKDEDLIMRFIEVRLKMVLAKFFIKNIVLTNRVSNAFRWKTENNKAQQSNNSISKS